MAWYEIPSLLKPRLHGMIHHTSTIPLEMGPNRVSEPSQIGVSCGSDVRFEVFPRWGLRGEVLNTTLLERGDTHERCCTYQRVIT